MNFFDCLIGCFETYVDEDIKMDLMDKIMDQLLI